MVNISDYTIEHVMPQNPNLSHEWQEMLGEGWVEVQGKYLHTLGNLTLTGYNSELSDRPFQEKKSMEGGFDDSPIRLNSYLRRISSWNEEQILVRAGNWLRKLKKYGGFRYYRRRHLKFIDLRREILQSIRWSTMNI